MKVRLNGKINWMVDRPLNWLMFHMWVILSFSLRPVTRGPWSLNCNVASTSLEICIPCMGWGSILSGVRPSTCLRCGRKAEMKFTITSHSGIRLAFPWMNPLDQFLDQILLQRLASLHIISTWVSLFAPFLSFRFFLKRAMCLPENQEGIQEIVPLVFWPTLASFPHIRHTSKQCPSIFTYFTIVFCGNRSAAHYNASVQTFSEPRIAPETLLLLSFAFFGQAHDARPSESV